MDSDYTVYYLNTESYIGRHDSIDLVGFLAIASSLKVPLLTLAWQSFHARLGLGGSGDVRQGLLDMESSLAMKVVNEEDKAQREAGVILRIFANELLALGHPNLRQHPHIIELLGISWHNPSLGEVWPILVFEKSHFGDLHHFSTLPVWDQLAFADRLDVCLQIGSAVADIHDCDIVHGDIKPENVLMFKTEDGKYVARITDFGFSFGFQNDTDRVALPRSRPWNAPEADRATRKFSLLEAKQADIFSYAMLCFWVLFSKELPGVKNADGNPCMDSVAVLASLKRDDLMVGNVANLPTEGLDWYQRQVLMDFLQSGLQTDPGNRPETLRTWTLLAQYIGNKEAEAIDMTTAEDTVVIDGTPKFELANILDQVHSLDPEFRTAILRCLEKRVFSEKDLPELSNDRIQLAICYFMGFGGARNEQRMSELCSTETNTALFHQAVESIKSRSRTYSLHPLIRQGHQHRHMRSMGGSKPEDTGFFSKQEHVLRRELEGMANSINDHTCTLTLAIQLVFNLEHQGSYDTAEPLLVDIMGQLTDFVGKEHTLVLQLMSSLASIQLKLGKFGEALMLRRELVSTCERIRGDKDILTLNAKMSLCNALTESGRCNDAEKVVRNLVDTAGRVFGPDHPYTALSMEALARPLCLLRRFEEAEILYRQVVDVRIQILGPNHGDTLDAMSSLAVVYQDQGRLSAAEEIFTEVVQLTRNLLGDMHPKTLMFTLDLAENLRRQCRLHEAADMSRAVLNDCRQVLGDDHPDTIHTMLNLATIYKDYGQFSTAEDLFTKVVESSSRVFGDSDPRTLRSNWGLVEIYLRQERLADAEKLGTSVIKTQRLVLGDDHKDTLTMMSDLASIYYQQGRLNDALILEEEAVARSRSVLGSDHPNMLLPLGTLAIIYDDLDRWKDAIPLYEEALATSRKVRGNSNRDTLLIMANLVGAYRGTEDSKRAEKLQTEGRELMKGLPGGTKPSIVVMLERAFSSR